MPHPEKKQRATKKPVRDIIFDVREPIELMAFLTAMMPDKSRNAIKSLLTHNQVRVGTTTVTKYNHPLKPGQQVAISKEKGVLVNQYHGVKILFEDAHIIVVEKDAGLLSISTDREKRDTAYSIVSSHVKRQNPGAYIFVIHRLDRETSGTIMFAKSKKVQEQLQANWQEAVHQRHYIALVEGRVNEPAGTITTWLKEDKNYVMHSSSVDNGGQMAVTHFEVLKSNANYSLLQITLETGRKNQIRVHMQAIGHPVVGDKKYGSIDNPISRLGLHAQVLSFEHPITKEVLTFKSTVPRKFLRVFKSNR
jgi:23S rRNA pseudouridine1911/1915/1917 synthase